jgi:mono/diheme cytochrome c family protein
MGEAVDASLEHLRTADIMAMVSYLRTVSGVAGGDLKVPRSDPAPASFAARESSAEPESVGRTVYAGACVGCHGWTGISPGIAAATLIGTRAVNDPAATNVAEIVIHGGQRHAPPGPANMPAFGSTYSDEEIAGVANFVTARFGAQASELTAAQVAKLRAATE